MLRNLWNPWKLRSPLFAYLSVFSSIPEIRPAYYFCRVIDDYADWDTQIPNWIDGFPAMVSLLKSHLVWWQTNSTPALSWEFSLLDELVHSLERKGIKSDKIKKVVWDFLDWMVLEYERRIGAPKALNRDELMELYDKTFGPSIDITLLLFWSQNTYQDVVEFWRLQWRLYALRDIRTDFSRNMINIPNEVMWQVDSNIDWSVSLSLLLNSKAFQDWREKEYRECLQSLQALRERTDIDSAAHKVLSLKIASMRKLII